MDGFPFLPNSFPFFVKKLKISSSRAVHIFSRCTVTAIDVCEMMILAWQRVLKMCAVRLVVAMNVLYVFIHLRLWSICFLTDLLCSPRLHLFNQSTSHLFKVYCDSYRCMFSMQSAESNLCDMGCDNGWFFCSVRELCLFWERLNSLKAAYS